jgi:hypothetical protein
VTVVLTGAWDDDHPAHTPSHASVAPVPPVAPRHQLDTLVADVSDIGLPVKMLLPLES